MSDAAPFHLRDAAPGDLAGIAGIYGHYVRTSRCTFEEVPPSPAEMGTRLDAIRTAGLPWRIAAAPDGAVLGYAYAGRFRARSAYRYTIENSVYIATGRVGRGLGVVLMQDLIGKCTALGYRQMLAVIGDSGNEASIRLHTRLGFRAIGHEAAVGLKFGQWVDVVLMQLALGDGATALPQGEPARYAF
jgi:phosphinothricin acetyltransferase